MKRFYELPLTQIGGKIRIKERENFKSYGLPVAPRQILINENHYVEWQISYDRVSGDGFYHFIAANGKKKILFELSEIIFDFFSRGVIVKNDLEKIKIFLENNDELVENKMQITRSSFYPKSIAGFSFLESFVSYPLLILKKDEFVIEIIIREKQRAMGV